MIKYCLTKVVMWDIIVTFVSIFTVILFCSNLLIRCPWSNQRYHFGLTISPCTLCHVIVSYCLYYISFLLTTPEFCLVISIYCL